MTQPPGADPSTPAAGDDPHRTDGARDLWPGWTGEAIPALFTHLYLFRLAAHMILSPAELRSIADKVEQLTAGLQRVSEGNDDAGDDDACSSRAP